MIFEYNLNQKVFIFDKQGFRSEGEIIGMVVDVTPKYLNVKSLDDNKQSVFEVPRYKSNPCYEGLAFGTDSSCLMLYLFNSKEQADEFYKRIEVYKFIHNVITNGLRLPKVKTSTLEKIKELFINDIKESIQNESTDSQTALG